MIRSEVFLMNRHFPAEQRHGLLPSLHVPQRLRSHRQRGCEHGILGAVAFFLDRQLTTVG